jgi:hypothetical protein
MRVTRHNDPAWWAAYAAFREVLPEMPEAQAKHQTTHAIAYAAANHTDWFWRGVYGDGQLTRAYDDEAMKPLGVAPGAAEAVVAQVAGAGRVPRQRRLPADAGAVATVASAPRTRRG